ncbi:RagB/SusD family nutrient uptake outer membrane protein [Chitinophaga pendula]|uniref:RagB/SusD family nutrient uptake outer membrane protein n=1 Tax=Chitinophaga TaxID=79328 RepID=UPI000BAF4066|nr:MULTISPECIES: RagB/SusD family nutrient uptake outer membrane protein [Chitinophaga]ASZ13410.1 RagB/SusD family nutrient uptake outer membrane protein [Chitinophaga sp. MD30]UCJ08967.1 RagB/SusD family nutrient uptake outer membrane protein [Chitinophaga pendula]
MKKWNFKYTLLAACPLLLATACTKIDVPVENELTPDNFPKTEKQMILATGPAYVQFRNSYATSFWQLQTLSTDEAILPSRAGGWYDGGRYQQMHYHNWTADNAIVADSWNWGFSTISTCNRILWQLEKADETPFKKTVIAELRTLRAISLYFMMDAYGNIPVPVTFGSADLPVQKKRTDVFAFIEKEIQEVIPQLSTANDATTYGRPNKFTAFALLAKMYLNATQYDQAPKYTQAVAMCDSIIVSRKYDLEDDFVKMFYPDNGPRVKEFIFAVPYDQANAKGCQFSWMSLHPALQPKYNLAYRLSNPVSTLPAYYAQFNLAGDVRNDMWLIGKQSFFDGRPIIIKTTKKGLDNNYNGPDPTAPVDFQLEFTPNVTLVNADRFEVGGDELGKAKGIRNIKYYPDVTATSRDQSNDVAVFRYADVLLMKAEAELRGAAVTNGETPESLVNQIRTKRKATTVGTITLDELLMERARELNWEGWRRNDLIRYGKYEGSWGYKTDNNTFKRIFPIPSAESILNPSLQQNPGY